MGREFKCEFNRAEFVFGCWFVNAANTVLWNMSAAMLCEFYNMARLVLLSLLLTVFC